MRKASSLAVGCFSESDSHLLLMLTMKSQFWSATGRKKETLVFDFAVIAVDDVDDADERR